MYLRNCLRAPVVGALLSLFAVSPVAAHARPRLENHELDITRCEGLCRREARSARPDDSDAIHGRQATPTSRHFHSVDRARYRRVHLSSSSVMPLNVLPSMTKLPVSGSRAPM